jgi:hypothetical protein
MVSDSTPMIFGIEGPVRSRSRMPTYESGLCANAWARRPVSVLLPTPPFPLRTLCYLSDMVLCFVFGRWRGRGETHEDLLLHI